MRQAPKEKLEKPPGVIATLSAGFDLTTRHIWLIILPFVLDVFYWLGPRLSIEALVESNLQLLGNEPAFSDMIDQILPLASQVNLFTSISIPLIGIPALMNGGMPENTPISPSIFPINETGLWLLLFPGLSILGLLLTTFYLGLISLVLKGKDGEQRVKILSVLGSLLRSVVRLIGLGLVFLLVLLAVWIPLLPVAALMGFLAGGLFIGVLLIGLVLVATYLSLAVPGIVYQERPVLSAVVDSVRIVHRNILPTLNLLMVALLISSGMNLLWHLADDGSWLTIVSIAGHAFISTALVAAFFIYYRDRSARIIVKS